MASLRVVEPPATEPVTIDEVVEFLRIDVEVGGEPPATLSALVAAAREVAESRTARALITQTLELGLDAFPAGEIRIPRPPLQEIEVVTYRDAGGVEQTLDPSAYVTDTASEPGRIAPAPGCSWPVTDGTPGSVRIRFVAGYGVAGEAIPSGIRTAILMLIGGWWEQPEAISHRQMHEVPMAVDTLLGQHRAHGWIG